LNLLHLTTYLQGGTGRIIQDLLLSQKSEGCCVSLVTTKTEFPGYCNYEEFIDCLENNDIFVIKVDSLFKRDLLLNLRAVERVKSEIQNQKIDLIHCHSAIPSLVALIARSSFGRFIPIIQTMHGWGQNKTIEHEEQDQIILNGVDQIVPVSFSSQNVLISKGVDQRNIKVIYNGVGHPSYLNREEENKDLERLILMKKKTRLIGCVGSVTARKNQRLLIEALRHLLAWGNNLHVVFIGEGDQLEELRAYVLENGLSAFCEFLGYRQNADVYIPIFDVLVLPSLAEGLPVTVIEGFRDKVPVLGSNIPEMVELIMHERTGFIFESEDSVSLAKTLEMILQMDSFKLENVIYAAHQFYLKHLRFEIMAASYTSLYKSFL